jgi:SNF2 family DNA or RNA helicase
MTKSIYCHLCLETVDENIHKIACGDKVHAPCFKLWSDSCVAKQQNIKCFTCNKKQPYKSRKVYKCMKRYKKMIKMLDMDKKQYQVDGVQWAIENELNHAPMFNVRGGFLGDEMGLGKTIIMTGILMSNSLLRTLIIVPLALLDQWKRQISDISNDEPLEYHGTNKKNITKQDIEEKRIVIATYTEISIIKGHPSVLHDIEWSRVIFDEAHHLRNCNTAVYAGARKLKAGIRWLVSGTPIQNSKNDFYALCGILRIPSEYYRDKTKHKELSTNFILRRTKKKVGINLTDIHLHKNTVEWSNEGEKELAKNIHANLKFSNLPGSSENFNKLPTFSALIRAKQICVLPRLLPIKLSDDVANSSSKLDKVISDILKNKDNGDGKLIFCQFREEINEIMKRLQNNQMNVAVIDGTTTASKRKKALNSIYDALILQIQTCCEGLNLQANYNEIYFVSPHWNPFVEEQAVARCHRIGQTKPVKVYRYEMEGFDTEHTTKSLETHIHEKQESKLIISTELLKYT